MNDDRDFFTDRQLTHDPFGYYAELRECPVHREPKHGVYMVPRHDDVMDLLRDREDRFSTCNVVSGPWPGIRFEGQPDDISDLIDEQRDSLPLSDYFAAFDGDKHRAHRSLLGRLFTPRRMKENEEFLWRLADRQIDTFIERGQCDFIASYGYPFTQLAIADLLGVPEEDHPRFASEIKIKKLRGDARNDLGTQDEWFVEYVEQRRREPREDVLSHLANTTFPDGSLSAPIDVARVAAFLFAAGQQTTVDLLTAALVVLADDPDLQDRLRADRALIPAFVEETLRFESPVKCNFRMTKRTFDIEGTEVPAGASVLLMLGSANRDPARFDRPDEFWLERPNAADHLAFGRGAHACPGAPLARLEGRVSIERLLDRLGEIRLDEAVHGAADARRFAFEPNFLMRRLSELHLTFTPNY